MVDTQDADAPGNAGGRAPSDARRSTLRAKVGRQLITLFAGSVVSAFVGIVLFIAIQTIFGVSLGGDTGGFEGLVYAVQGLGVGLLVWLAAWLVPRTRVRLHIAVLLVAVHRRGRGIGSDPRAVGFVPRQQEVTGQGAAVLAAPRGDAALVLMCRSSVNGYNTWWKPGSELSVGGFAIPCRGDGVVVGLEQPATVLVAAQDVMGLSPDGRYLVLAGLRVLDVRTGATTQLQPAPDDVTTAGWGTGFWHDDRHVDVVLGGRALAVCEIPAGTCTRAR